MHCVFGGDPCRNELPVTPFKLTDHFHAGMWKGGGAETLSGAGSTLEYTANLRPALARLVADLPVRRFLDAPCGDFNWMQHVDLGDAEYIGLDIVEDVISMNRERYAAPRRLFALADITRNPLPAADLLLCRDLLLHLHYESIADLFENIVSSDIEHILITSYVAGENAELHKRGKARALDLTKDPFDFREPPGDRRLADWIPGFPERYLFLYSRHEFAEMARRCIPRLRALSAGAAGPGRIRQWLPGRNYPVTERPVDSTAVQSRMPASVLEYQHLGVDRSLLVEALFVSLRTFGFFTRHAPRYLEYPWILENVLGCPEPGNALDLGAGVSPVPLVLASRGWSVTTVDYSDMRRTLAEGGKLNEWGFLDYAEADRRIRSINQDFSRAELGPASCDVLYSVSVIEHMPASVRRAVFDAIGRCLKSGGRLILTLDLVPGTLRLWNRDRGKAVEDPKAHGTLDDALAELRESGIDVEHFEIRRGLPRSRTDILLLRACKR